MLYLLPERDVRVRFHVRDVLLELLYSICYVLLSFASKVHEIVGSSGPKLEKVVLPFRVVLTCYRPNPCRDERAAELVGFFDDVAVPSGVGSDDAGRDDVEGDLLVVARERVSVVNLRVHDGSVDDRIAVLLVDAEFGLYEALVVREDEGKLELWGNVLDVECRLLSVRSRRLWACDRTRRGELESEIACAQAWRRLCSRSR